jgi:hypothetical protein
VTSSPTTSADSQLLSLTYLSTATQPFGRPELEALLVDSRERNHGIGLTGALLYAGGHFIQTLEGPAPVVDATFETIDRDPRHRDLLVALREPIDERAFPDWSMGFEMVDLDDAAELPEFNDYLEHQTVSPEDGQHLGRAGIFHRVFRDNMR